jgi:hypothetical protein
VELASCTEVARGQVSHMVALIPRLRPSDTIGCALFWSAARSRARADVIGGLRSLPREWPSLWSADYAAGTM